MRGMGVVISFSIVMALGFTTVQVYRFDRSVSQLMETVKDLDRSVNKIIWSKQGQINVCPMCHGRK